MKHYAPFFKVEDDYISDSSMPSPSKSVLSQFEIKSSQTFIMLAMMIEAVNFEEKLASMKAKLERLSKESAEKDAHIKRQEQHITKLLKKLEKGPYMSSNKSASSKEDKMGSN